jgi:hypothetical protein
MLGLFVLGPLALFPAWRSRQMSTSHKVVFAVAMGAYTAVLIILTLMVFWVIWDYYQRVLEIDYYP